MNTLLNSWLLGGWSYPALTFLIVCGLKSSALVLLTWSLTLVQRRCSALLRSWVWRGCILALASLMLWPFAPSLMERLRPRVVVSGAGMMQTIQQGHELKVLATEKPSTTSTPDLRESLQQALSPTAEPLVAQFRTSWLAATEETVFRGWWIGALLIFGIRLARAFCGRWWLRRQSRGLSQRNGYQLVSGLRSPIVTGWRKACIWLPTEAAEWSEAKVRAVCLHESAHHQRHDGAWQWLGWLTASIWWWNPLSWLALRYLTSEAELAADELALFGEIAAPDYAQVLVEIAAGGQFLVQPMGVPMLGRSSIKQRVKIILSGAKTRGRFGKVARMVLIGIGLAGVIAAGVESRYAQTPPPSNPLTKGERELVERCLALLVKQVEQLSCVHLKLTSTHEFLPSGGGKPQRSPLPEQVEAWVNHPAMQSRAEWRPRVTRWLNGAAPWSIENATAVCDDNRSWNQRNEDDIEFIDTNASSFRGHTNFFRSFPWFDSRLLLSMLQQIQRTGFKNISGETYAIREEGGKIQVEKSHPAGKEVEIWLVDTSQRLGVTMRQTTYRGLSYTTSRGWQGEEWGSLPDGTHYPKRWQTSGNGSTTRYEVAMLEVIPTIPEVLLLPPAKKASPYIATDGQTRNAEALEARFVNADDGLPVPEVTVQYEINGGNRLEALSDPLGRLRIPLPAEEVKNLRFWGQKVGFVMQRVQWSRYGDPLKLPGSYTVKLFPAGKPIGGRVVNAHGEPVPDAEVNISHTGGPNRRDVFADVQATSQTVKTNADGHWSMTGYAENLSGAVIRVEHPNHKRLALDYRTATGQDYASLRDGNSKVVLSGESAEVSGLVTDEAGKPVAGCAVTIGEDRHGHLAKPQAKTGVDGRYTVRTHEMGKDWITFEAPGFQPQTRQIELVAGKAVPISIQLAKGRVLRVQIVDEAGVPLPKVWVVANRWQQKRPLWFEATTDDQGRFEWTGAPADEVTWEILKGGTALRDFPLLPTDDWQTVTLRPAIRFTGMVLDAQTGQHVSAVKITPGDTRRSANDIYWHNERARSFRDGTFTLEVWWMREDHKLRFEAEGYTPFESALFTPKQQDEPLQIKLVPKN